MNQDSVPPGPPSTPSSGPSDDFLLAALNYSEAASDTVPKPSQGPLPAEAASAAKAARASSERILSGWRVCQAFTEKGDAASMGLCLPLHPDYKFLDKKGDPITCVVQGLAAVFTFSDSSVKIVEACRIFGGYAHFHLPEGVCQLRLDEGSTTFFTPCAPYPACQAMSREDYMRLEAKDAIDAGLLPAQLIQRLMNPDGDYTDDEDDGDD